jgi:flagellar protein FlgJ
MKILNPSFKPPQDSPLREAAQGMEANFLKELIRNMRNTVGESEEDQNNKGLQLFRGMLDEEYAQKSAKTQGIGLADLIVKQVTQLQEAQDRRGPVPVRQVSENDFIKK